MISHWDFIKGWISTHIFMRVGDSINAAPPPVKKVGDVEPVVEKPIRMVDEERITIDVTYSEK